MAEQLETTGGAAEIYDSEWRLVYLTSQFRFFAGDKSLEELGVAATRSRSASPSCTGWFPTRSSWGGCGPTSH